MKIFGIGLNKTGTTSLSLAFKKLGFKHFDRRPAMFKLFLNGDFESIFEEIEAFDSFEDWPWPLMVPQLLEHYGKNAKFILTRRKTPDVWLNSIKQHALRTHPKRNPRSKIFGATYPQGCEELYLTKYNTHLEDVRAIFATNGANDRFLELCFEEGDGWSELCSFLNLPLVDGPFPKSNVSSQVEIPRSRLLENLAGIEGQSKKS